MYVYWHGPIHWSMRTILIARISEESNSQLWPQRLWKRGEISEEPVGGEQSCGMHSPGCSGWLILVYCFKGGQESSHPGLLPQLCDGHFGSNDPQATVHDFGGDYCNISISSATMQPSRKCGPYGKSDWINSYLSDDNPWKGVDGTEKASGLPDARDMWKMCCILLTDSEILKIWQISIILECLVFKPEQDSTT